MDTWSLWIKSARRLRASGQPVIERVRSEVWRQFISDPPRVIAVGRGLFPDRAENYNKLALWSQFSHYMQAHNALYDERSFRPALCGDRAYRIYLRKPDGPAPHRNPLLIASYQPRAGPQKCAQRGENSAKYAVFHRPRRLNAPFLLHKLCNPCPILRVAQAP